MGDTDSILGDLEDRVTCWICFELFKDPVTLFCSHSYCKECAIKMYKKNPLCAFCRREFGLPLPPVNNELVELVKFYKRKQSGEDVEEIETYRTSEVEQDSPWFTLPDEVSLGILSHLEPRDLGRSGLVCQHFRQLSEDNWLWREVCRERFPFVQISRYNNSWKRCYIARHKMERGWQSGRPGDFKVNTLRGHTNYVSCFDYYRNNIVSGSADNTLKIWNVNETKPLHTLTGHSGIVNTVHFNEVHIVSGAADSKLKIWDTGTGIGTKTLTASSSVGCLQFSGAEVVTGAADGRVALWDMRASTTTPQHTMHGHSNAVVQLEFGNNRIISAASDSIRIWDPRSGQSVKQLTGGSVTCFQSVGTSDDLVSGEAGGAIRVWSISSGSCVATLDGHTWGSAVTSIQSDGERVVAGCNDSSIKVYDLKRRTQLHVLKDHKGPVWDCQFDGHKIVSASADNCLKVWDAKAGTRLYSLLGGSLQQRGNNPNHPTKAGCSALKFDEGRIVASFASLLRVYNFTGEDVGSSSSSSSS
jgi:WD40 repeat protein